MISRDHIIIWPAYLDKTLSRSRGRRAPRNLSVKNPTAEAIKEAATALGMKAEIESGSHPSTWWKSTGKVLLTIEQDKRKQQLIKEIASKMLEPTQKKSSVQTRKKKSTGRREETRRKT